jgi:putative ABC transport system permease protein
LPIETVNRLRTEVARAEAVIPVVAALTPVDVDGDRHGFFLLGGSCQIELSHCLHRSIPCGWLRYQVKQLS